MGDLLVLGGEPGQVRALDHNVETQEAPGENLIGPEAAVTNVLDPQGPVEPSRRNVAEAGPGMEVRVGVLPSDPGRDEAAHETMRDVGRDVEAVGVLSPREDAAVEADEGEPLCLAPRPPEGRQGVHPGPEVRNRRRRPRRHVRILRPGPTGDR